MSAALYELGRKWADDPARPRVNPNTQADWTKLIEEWAGDSTVPLLVRKSNKNRGALICGAEGRLLIPTDNSPAQWAFAWAVEGACPKLDQVHSLLQRGDLPVAMILNKDERERALYRGIGRLCLNTSTRGWKLAHIEGVGLNRSGKIESFPLSDIRTHFTKFMSPSNMFVVPAKLSGLAEVQVFVDGYRSSLKEPC